MTRICAVEQLAEMEGTRLGSSGWHLVTQDLVNTFADVTGDTQWIHVDPQRAEAGPFGAPVAHGYLTLAMLTRMLNEVVEVTGVGLVLNKGLDRLRFSAPVPVGSRIGADVDVASVRARPRRFWEIRYGVTMKIEGTRAAALAAEAIFLYQQQ
jgi:acyl dehydratase